MVPRQYGLLDGVIGSVGVLASNKGMSENTDFAAAEWGYGWDDALGDSAFQGTANLRDDGVYLEVPFGWLLGSDRVAMPEVAELPEEAEYLSGFAQTGDWFVLQDCFPVRASRSMSGGARRTICANYLFSCRAQLDPTSDIERVTVSFSALNS